MRKCDVGGQAVIEGVMMRGKKGVATAVRKEDGEIVVKYEKTLPFVKRHPKLNIPLIRGIFILIDSLIEGIKSLNYSSEFFIDDDEEPSKFEKWLTDKLGDKLDKIVVFLSMLLSVAISVGLFVGIPTFVASFFEKLGFNSIALNIVEAILRIVILLLYMAGIGKMKEINRVFQYHGAEHKTIFCYEAGEPLTVENITKYSRFHPRCGTNFLFLIMFVSIIIFTFTGWGGFWERLAFRIVLIPVVSGITYEIIKWLGRSNTKLSKIIAAPGLKLQKLTTREPDGDQIEVAVQALLASEGIEVKKKISELIQMGTTRMKKSDTARLDAQVLLGSVLGVDKTYLITNFDKEVENEDKDKYLELVEKRSKCMPIKYILGETEFMGLDFCVAEGVLIPRNDTEILVEEVLKNISEDDSLLVCDLCTGSGAIAISLAHYRKNIKVDAIDYYEAPERITKENIVKNKVSAQVTFIKSDLLKEVMLKEKKYDIIVSNPPYIRSKEIETLMSDVKDYEPMLALDGGRDGLKFYRKIVEQSKNVLKKDGIIAFEIGYDQAEEVESLLELNGYRDIEIKKDLAGLDRVIVARFNG